MGHNSGFGTGLQFVGQGRGLWDRAAALRQDCSLWDRSCGIGARLVGQGSGFATGLQFVGQGLWDRAAACGTGLQFVGQDCDVCGTGPFVREDCNVSWALLALGPSCLHRLLISIRLE